ncbi:MAG: preprotein translocase subunit YajC [SAR324 cluster bacterium]|nr:preprotein translocase subunit YajC [SAR324 cluster bacterium]MCH8885554.1 preprotein translocase subunit YajC [SAR324 cluster bacterium]
MGGGGGGVTGGGIMNSMLFPMIMIFGIFYFLLIRPQQKRAKAQREMNASLSKGDEVVTDGGIYGTVQKVGENHVTLEIAPKVSIRVVRSRITELVKENKSKNEKKGAKAKEVEE